MKGEQGAAVAEEQTKSSNSSFQAESPEPSTRQPQRKRRIITPNISVPVDCPAKAHPNRAYKKNRICTTKYNCLFFIPQNISEQFFGRFANMYFLSIQIINFLPGMQVFSREVQLLPFLFVLGVTMIKDFCEDWQRRKADKAVNDNKCRLYDKHLGRFVQAPWSRICVGDIVHLSCNETVPADMIVLKTKSAEDEDELGTCYVDTSNLDGESNLKQRYVANEFGKLNEQGVEDIDFRFVVECDLPSMNLNKFHGSIVFSDGNKIVVDQENLLLRDYVLKNTAYIDGLVVYAGHDTKAMLNNKGPRYKRSRLEIMMNLDLVWCILLLIIMCAFCALARAFWKESYEKEQVDQVPFILPGSGYWAQTLDIFWDFFVFYILFQTIIPISLYVTIEFIKLGQIYLTIYKDTHFVDSCTGKKLECRALNITEDLGQVEYIFCDKTGTLTENTMEFRRCTISGIDYNHEPELNRSKMTYEQTQKSLRKKSLRLNQILKDKLDRITQEYTLKIKDDIERSDQVPASATLNLTQEEEKIRDFFVLLAICNTAMAADKNGHKDILNMRGDTRDENASTTSISQTSTTSTCSSESSESLKSFKTRRLKLFDEFAEQTENSGGKKAKPIYESESPDEVSLVTTAFKYHVALLKRARNYVKVMMPNGTVITYEVLSLLPFDSNRKRMSIIIRCPLTKRVIVFCKGADQTILSQLSIASTADPAELAETRRSVLRYSEQGYRVLCMARRYLTEEQFSDWHEQFQRLQQQSATEQQLAECVDKIENGLELLGATAIEDRLQYRVPEVITSLRAAGIVIWVLTGDKMETAVNIANSCSLFDSKMKLITISLETVKSKLSARKALVDNIIFVRSEIKKRASAGSRCIQQVDEKCNKSKSKSICAQFFRMLYQVLHFEHNIKFATASERAAWGLVIDGPSLNYMLQPGNVSLFIELTQYCNSVLVCRATPAQKSAVVMCVKIKLNRLTLAIGDGANDVAMLQTAHVGVGVSGKEGTQAVMASDFAISKFHHLEKLLLVHGNLCYYRLAQTIQYYFYKNSLIIFIIFFFQFSCGFSGQSPVDDMHLMLVNLVYNTFPAVLRGIYEKDYEEAVLLANPKLYERGRLSRVYTKYSFWVDTTDSIYQSLVIYYFCYFTYLDTDIDFYAFGIILFTIVILTNLLQIAIESQYWYRTYVGSFILSFAFFYLIVGIYDIASWEWFFNYLGGQNYLLFTNVIQDSNFWFLLVICPVTCLMPRTTLRVIQEIVKPKFQV